MTNIMYVKPDEIVVPGELGVARRDKLKEYFDLFLKGTVEHIPPALVVRKDIRRKYNHIASIRTVYGRKSFVVEGIPFDNESGAKALVDRLIDELYQDIVTKTNGAELYLLDGNHRTIAATLTHTPICVYELEDNLDFKRMREKIKKGFYPDLNRDEQTLDDLRTSFERFICFRKSYIMNVKQRVEKLVSQGSLPPYMVRQYKSTR